MAQTVAGAALSLHVHLQLADDLHRRSAVPRFRPSLDDQRRGAILRSFPDSNPALPKKAGDLRSDVNRHLWTLTEMANGRSRGGVSMDIRKDGV